MYYSQILYSLHDGCDSETKTIRVDVRGKRHHRTRIITKKTPQEARDSVIELFDEMTTLGEQSCNLYFSMRSVNP